MSKAKTEEGSAPAVEEYKLKRLPECWVIVRAHDEAQHAVRYSTRSKAKLAERNLRLGLVRFQPPVEDLGWLSFAARLAIMKRKSNSE